MKEETLEALSHAHDVKVTDVGEWCTVEHGSLAFDILYSEVKKIVNYSRGMVAITLNNDNVIVMKAEVKR